MKSLRAMQRHRGATLIEVLVSILIVTLGLLALAGLMASSSRLAKTSEYRAVATALAGDLADRMRANRPGADAGNYNLASTAVLTSAPSSASCATATACTAAELAGVDMAQWKRSIYNSLPSGTGHVAYVSGSSAVDVWIIWSDPSALTSSDSSDNKLINGTDTKRCPPNFTNASSLTCLFFRVGL